MFRDGLVIRSFLRLTIYAPSHRHQSIDFLYKSIDWVLFSIFFQISKKIIFAVLPEKGFKKDGG